MKPVAVPLVVLLLAACQTAPTVPTPTVTPTPTQSATAMPTPTFSAARPTPTASPTAATSGSWTPVTDLGVPVGAMTSLWESTVLEAGGQGTDGEPLASAALFDSSTGKWSRVDDLATPRGVPMLVTLADGKALIAGGFATAQGEGERALASAEIYDPVTGSWTETGSMAEPRVYGSAVLLDDGRVLVAGGASPSEYLPSAEIFDPQTGAWSRTGDMKDARAGALIELDAGHVLIAGGGSTSAEVFDMSSGTWSVTGAMITSRDDVQAVALTQWPGSRVRRGASVRCRERAV